MSLLNKRTERVAETRYYMLLNLLSFLKPEDLILIGVPQYVIRDVSKIRQDDDFYGLGAMALGIICSSCSDMTPMDRSVVAQTLAAASDCVSEKRVLTAAYLKDKDVTQAEGVLRIIIDAISSKIDGAPPTLSPGAMAEEFDALVTFGSRYNRDIFDKTFNVFKGL